MTPAVRCNASYATNASGSASAFRQGFRCVMGQHQGGMFGGNGDAATDHPSSFAGAFTATWRDDELHRAESIAGSFGAHKEP